MKTLKKTLLTFLVLSCFINVFATKYEVGQGKPYTHIYDVPVNKLKAGDIIMVYAKPNREAYKEKFMLAGIGTADNPIQFIGVPDANGNKPILDGQNAVSGTEKGNYFWNEDRSLIKVGQGGNEAENIIIDGFELKNVQRNNTFTDDTGAKKSYLRNAAGVFIEAGTNIIVRNCDIHHNENGIQAAKPMNLLLAHSYIHENGAGGGASSYLEHNVYIDGGAGTSVTVEFCKFGELLNDGQQAKFRTETMVFRYNWIEGGRNGQLDIVDHAKNATANAYVYGNIIVKPGNTHNGRVVHYGHDNGNHNSGTLYFFNNTVINKSNRTAYLFQLNSDNRKAVVDNNIFYKTDNNSVYLLNDPANASKISGNHNWFYQGTNNTDFLNNSVSGANPGFTDASGNDYSLKAASEVRDVVKGYTFPSGHTLDKEYVIDLGEKSRGDDGNLDLGAYEYTDALSTAEPYHFAVKIHPNPTSDFLFVETSKKAIAEIYNLQGQKMKTLALTEGKNKVDICTLIEGVYILKIGSQNIKLVKH